MPGQVSKNVHSVREQIAYKVSSIPFLASNKAVNGSITDQDTFPYPRYFRGMYQSDRPVVFEREAGWRPRNDNCYCPNRPCIPDPVQFCWQVPCSTTFPCVRPPPVAAAQTACVYLSP